MMRNSDQLQVMLSSWEQTAVILKNLFASSSFTTVWFCWIMLWILFRAEASSVWPGPEILSTGWWILKGYFLVKRCVYFETSQPCEWGFCGITLPPSVSTCTALAPDYEWCEKSNFSLLICNYICTFMPDKKRNSLHRDPLTSLTPNCLTITVKYRVSAGKKK